jgi:tetratricopeptide (TPR) repeat protein
MAGKHKSTGRMAGKSLLFVLLGFALLAFWGCNGDGRPAPDVPSTVTIPSDKTEAELLAELDRKFENPQAHYELARLYHRSQNWGKAEYRYNQALSFDPANRAAQAGLVKMFIDRGETAKGEQFANSYLRQAAVSVDETLRLAWEFDKVGLDDYALRGFRQALDAAPDSFEANKQIGFYYLGKGDTAKAKQHLMRSFELNPRQPDVAGALGRLGVVVELPTMPDEPTTGKPK